MRREWKNIFFLFLSYKSHLLKLRILRSLDKNLKNASSLRYFQINFSFILAHFTNQFSNSPPAAQSRSRICLCILGDDVERLRGRWSKEKKRNQNDARSIACLFLKLRFLFNLQDPH